MGIGVGCVLLSALLIALGANLIRHAAGKERLHRLPHRHRCYLCQPEWILGVLLLAIGGCIVWTLWADARRSRRFPAELKVAGRGHLASPGTTARGEPRSAAAGGLSAVTPLARMPDAGWADAAAVER